jgi:hypothetical protein
LNSKGFYIVLEVNLHSKVPIVHTPHSHRN